MAAGRASSGDSLGDVEFERKNRRILSEEYPVRFFEHYLKDKGTALPEAYVFETGTNVWRRYDAWPPPKARPHDVLSSRRRQAIARCPRRAEGYDEYVSDPAHPVPFIDYIADTVPQRYMVDDQRFAAKRPDVLTYETEPLTEDVTIAGPISPQTASIAS